MKFATYAVASGIACTAVTVHAYLKFHQFYLTCVYIAHSSAGLLVLYNTCLMFTIMLASLVQKLAFGSLRSIEIEHVYERSWYTLTETCLAMTIFRDDFNLQFFMSFISLLMCKISHWILQDRIDYVAQVPLLSRVFHVRLSSMIILLTLMDTWCARFYVKNVISSGPSMMIFFAFEYMVLIVMIGSLLVKYVFHRFDQFHEGSWEEKSTYIFYLELVTDFCRLIVYMTFFLTVFLYYGLPLHIVRDLYMTFRSFTLKVRDLVQYRRATANMQERYPNATQEELIAIDRTCIICREEMLVGKKLPCGHIFHFRCLRSWLERQQICPTCRTSVLEPRPRENPIIVNPVAGNNPAEASSPRAITSQESPSSRGMPIESPSTGSSQTVWIPAARIPLSSQQLGRLINIVPTRTSSSDQTGCSSGELDDETLKMMEGEQRDHIEERLEFLVGLQDRVSDLIVQITQYLDLTRSDPSACSKASSSTPETKEEVNTSSPTPDIN